MAQYYRLIKRACHNLRLPKLYSPHAPRAGFATESFLQGLEFTHIREMGRWTSDASLRTYLDGTSVVYTLSLPELQFRIKEAEFISSNLNRIWK